jgi:hypothetical protein
MATVAEKSLDDLRIELSNAIRFYELNVGDIMAKAASEGGSTLAEQVHEEYQALRDARWEIDKARIDIHNARYQSLVGNANKLADKATESVKDLKGITNIITTFTDLITVLGRMLIVLAI